MLGGRRRHFPLMSVALIASCVSPGPVPAPSPGVKIARPAGSVSYVFTSSQTSPGGTSRVRVTFTLLTSAAGSESAVITGYEHASGGGAFSAGEISPSCRDRLTARPGAVAVLPITPPPHRLADLLPDCVPEDLFGAASDILPLLMIQMQPAFRAQELRVVGDRLRFAGYETAWRLPPTLLDARVAADSGVVSLDSLTPSRTVIGWNTSPMQVDLLRLLAPGRRTLLSGREWFWARVVVDPRSGRLLSGHTVVDSLALEMMVPYADSTVPPRDRRPAPASGMPIAVTRSLELHPGP